LALDGRAPGGGIERIPVLSYRQGGTVYRTDGEFFIDDLDEIPSPILGTPRHELVTRFSGKEGDAVIVETSRGCPVNCAFCQYPKNDGGRMRYFSVDRVLAELSYLRSLGIHTIYFGDGIFTIRKERAERFFQYFLEEFTEATIHVELKLDMLTESLIPYVRPLVEQGRLTVGVGIQSVNMATLDRIGRPTKLHLLARSIEAIGSARTMRWDLIYGLPGDGLPDLIDGLELAYEKAPGARVCMQPLQVLPGTDMWRHTHQYGLIHERANPYHLLCSDTYSFEDVRRAEMMSELYALFGGPFRFAATPKPHGWGVDLHGMWRELFDEAMCAELHDGPRTLETMVRFVERLKEVCASRLGAEQHASVVEAIEWTLLNRFSDPASFARLAALTDDFRGFATRVSGPRVVDPAPGIRARLAQVLDGARVFAFRHPFHELAGDFGRVFGEDEGFTWVHTGDRSFTLAPDALDALQQLRGGDTAHDWRERLVASDPSWEGVDEGDLDTLLRVCARDRVVTLVEGRGAYPQAS
jgi:hypothetical protein